MNFLYPCDSLTLRMVLEDTKRSFRQTRVVHSCTVSDLCFWARWLSLFTHDCVGCGWLRSTTQQPCLLVKEFDRDLCGRSLYEEPLTKCGAAGGPTITDGVSSTSDQEQSRLTQKILFSLREFYSTLNQAIYHLCRWLCCTEFMF